MSDVHYFQVWDFDAAEALGYCIGRDKRDARLATAYCESRVGDDLHAVMIAAELLSSEDKAQAADRLERYERRYEEQMRLI